MNNIFTIFFLAMVMFCCGCSDCQSDGDCQWDEVCISESCVVSSFSAPLPKDTSLTGDSGSDTDADSDTDTGSVLDTDTGNTGTDPVPIDTISPIPFEWVFIKGGMYTRGSFDTIAGFIPEYTSYMEDFSISRTEVTRWQFDKCVSAGYCTHEAYDPTPERRNNPASYLGFNSALEYCVWQGGTLPTGYQWQYAARSGGKEFPLPWSKDANDFSLTVDHARLDYPGVGGYRSVCYQKLGYSEQGVCDLIGNVSEKCWMAWPDERGVTKYSPYGDNYDSKPPNDAYRYRLLWPSFEPGNETARGSSGGTNEGFRCMKPAPGTDPINNPDFVGSKVCDAPWGVIDVTTGACWHSEPTGVKVATIDEAKAYCDDLEAGGFDDWKLPLAVQFAGRLLYATGALPKDACTLADAENHPGCAHCEDSPVCMAMFPEDATSNARYWAFGSRLGEEPWAINLTFSHLYEIPQNYQDPPHQIKCIR